MTLDSCNLGRLLLAPWLYSVHTVWTLATLDRCCLRLSHVLGMPLPLTESNVGMATLWHVVVLWKCQKLSGMLVFFGLFHPHLKRLLSCGFPSWCCNLISPQRMWQQSIAPAELTWFKIEPCRVLSCGISAHAYTKLEPIAFTHSRCSMRLQGVAVQLKSIFSTCFG